MTKFQNGFKGKNATRVCLLERMQLVDSRRITTASNRREHIWLTVIDPTNKRSLLQACDDCGVVKSENSAVRNCKAIPGSALISGVSEGRASL